MNQRRSEMIDMNSTEGEKVRLVFHAPSRGLIGYQSRFLTDTRGTGVINRVFHSYGKYKGEMGSRRNGALIATETGVAVAYAIFNLQSSGVMFIEPQTKVYQGMIVGEHSKENDLAILKDTKSYKKAINIFPDIEIANIKDLEEENND